jgi:hypothetical protein
VKRKSKSSGHGVSEFSTHHERKEQKEMKTKRLRILILCLAVILAVTVFSVTDVLAWNWGVHAYIDDHLGKRGPLRNMNEIYGATGPDVFNFLFDHPDWLWYLYAQTHGFRADGQEYDTFMKLWDAARLGLGKAEAFGFVSHNDVWGADSTAHHAGITFGQGKGYVIEKATEIQAAAINGDLDSLPPLEALLSGADPDLASAIAFEFYHNLVEAAVDILVVRLDPMIGKKLASAAILRSPEFPLLLVKAYAKDFADKFNLPHPVAVKVILASEKEFRKGMVLYGQALMQDQDTAIELLAEQMADQAVGYLAGYGLTGYSAAELVPIAKGYIEVAMKYCERDYADEIEATIEFVREGLASHHISY